MKNECLINSLIWKLRWKDIFILFFRVKIGLLRFLRKKYIILYSDIKRKRFISKKCFKLNYLVLVNLMKDFIEFLKRYIRKNIERI